MGFTQTACCSAASPCFEDRLEWRCASGGRFGSLSGASSLEQSRPGDARSRQRVRIGLDDAISQPPHYPDRRRVQRSGCGPGDPAARTTQPPILRRLQTERWRSRPISRVLSWTVIPLGAPSPVRSSNLPGPDAGNVMRSLFGLAPGGVCRAGLLPDSRCALTAPFHPCRPAEAVLGGIFLLHFPSARAAQALPGTLPCGARTFLGIAGCEHPG